MMKWEAEQKGYTCNDCYLSMQNCHDKSICCEDETGLCDYFEEIPMKGEPMDRDEFMEIVYETFADEPDNVLANGIIEAADAYVEHEKAQLSQEGTIKGTTSDAISRQQALEKVRTMQTYKLFMGDDMILVDKAEVQTELMMLPTIQPEVLACGNGELVANPEPKEGHWIEGGIYRDVIECHCSECGQLMTTAVTVRMNFCPNCGAKMTISIK